MARLIVNETMSNKLIELHDSEIGEIKKNKNEIRIIFDSIIIHESKGKPGKDSGVVYSQKAELLFKGDCNLIGRIKQYPYLIKDGHFEVNGLSFRNEIPLPLKETGKIKFNIVPRNIDSEIEVTAKQAYLTLIGKPKYVENF